MDKQASEDTRILFVTTGVLLRKLVSKKNMLEYTHVILDEVSSLYTGYSFNYQSRNYDVYNSTFLLGPYCTG